MSCTGNGYLSGNMLVPFPFEDGSCLSWGQGTDAGAMQLALQRCFVDAGVSIMESDVSRSDWPALGVFSARGRALSFRLAAMGVETSISVGASSVRFPIVSGSAPWGWYTIVLSSEGLNDLFGMMSSPSSSGHSSLPGREGGFLGLCAKCVSTRPMGLNSILVYDGVNPKDFGPHFVLSGDVAVKPGYNMLLAAPDENGIELNAVPGAGRGVVPCGCTGDAPPQSPLASPDGHTRLFNDTCYDLEPAERTTIYVDGKPRTSRTLRIHAKCTACCTCQMYEEIVNRRLRPLADALRGDKIDISRLLNTYESAVGRFNNRMSAPTMDDITVRMTGSPLGVNLGSRLLNYGIKGRMNRCAFCVEVQNQSYFEILATVNSLRGSDKVVLVEANWSDSENNPLTKVADSASDITGETFTIYPGRALTIHFNSTKNEMVSEIQTGGYTGSASIGLSYKTESGSVRSLGTVDRTVEV